MQPAGDVSGVNGQGLAGAEVLKAGAKSSLCRAAVEAKGSKGAGCCAGGCAQRAVRCHRREAAAPELGSHRALKH